MAETTIQDSPEKNERHQNRSDPAGREISERVQRTGGTLEPKLWEYVAGWPVAFVRWLPWSFFMVFILALLGIAYFEVTSEGYRLVLPTLGKKLYKISFLHSLGRWRETRGLDLANCMALLLEICTLWAWDTCLKLYLGSGAEVHARWNEDRFRRVVMALAVAVIAFDCYLFARGTQALMWGDTSLSFTTVVTTAGWGILLVVVSLLSIQFQPHNKEHV